MANKTVELYESDGAVYRKVRRDLGGGQRVVTSDTEIHPDVEEFMEQNPNVRVRGYKEGADFDDEAPDPGEYTLDELGEVLGEITSVDTLLTMKRADNRSTAEGMYDERINVLLAGPSVPGGEEDEE